MKSLIPIHAFFLQRKISVTQLILASSVLFVMVYNTAFFKHVAAAYPPSKVNVLFILSIALVLTTLIALLLTLVTSRYTLKPILILLFILSSLSAYFMNTYDVVIDPTMIQNIFQTDRAETLDLFSLRMVLYLAGAGLLPALAIYKVNLRYHPIKTSLLYKTRDCAVCFFIIFITLLVFSKSYTSFFREHKPLRYYTNPTTYIYSLIKVIGSDLFAVQRQMTPVGSDAKVVEKDDDRDGDLTELVILVVGEAARADHFSLNGYKRETNPLLKKENIINFSHVCSCGTSTAYSVPCMFSLFPRKRFNNRKGKDHENVLDVLSHTGFIDILWRDNNSNSKGVALRVEYENYKDPAVNSLCPDGECRDEGMLIGLDQYIDSHKGRDILIVLHQMGSHGPAYSKRYPKAFEQFKPVCETNQLQECSDEEIINTYDNTILYTDYFLSKVIHFLKNYEKSHETAMIYFSDHGESLGENGVYLHGIPYLFAPESQVHVASIMWFGDEMAKDLDIEKIRKNKDNNYSHDNLFHSLLGLFEVETNVYERDMDIFHNGPNE